MYTVVLHSGKGVSGDEDLCLSPQFPTGIYKSFSFFGTSADYTQEPTLLHYDLSLTVDS
jgi:hypothetical protein